MRPSTKTMKRSDPRKSTEREDRPQAFDSAGADAGESSCDWVRDNLGALIDEELDSGEIRRIQAHRSDCHGCDAEEQLLREDWRVFASMPVPELEDSLRDPHGFLGRVQRRLRRDRQRTTLRFVAGAAAAAIVLLAILGPFVRPWTPPEDEAIIRDLSVLEDLQIVATVIDPSVIGDLLPPETESSDSTSEIYSELLDLLLEEELEGERS